MDKRPKWLWQEIAIMAVVIAICAAFLCGVVWVVNRVGVFERENDTPAVIRAIAFGLFTTLLYCLPNIKDWRERRR